MITPIHHNQLLVIIGVATGGVVRRDAEPEADPHRFFVFCQYGLMTYQKDCRHIILFKKCPQDFAPLPGDTGTIVAITARTTTGPTTTATIMDTTTTTADPTLQSGTSSPWRWKTKTETEVNSDFDPGCCSRRCCWRLQTGNSPWLDFNRPAIVLFTNIQFYSSLT